MKPINEMNLLEIAYTLEATEMLNPSIASRLRELHEQHRWIPVEERLPDKNDADEKGKVLWLSYGGHYESLRWDLGRDYFMTHWRRTDKP